MILFRNYGLIGSVNFQHVPMYVDLLHEKMDRSIETHIVQAIKCLLNLFGTNRPYSDDAIVIKLAIRYTFVPLTLARIVASSIVTGITPLSLIVATCAFLELYVYFSKTALRCFQDYFTHQNDFKSLKKFL